MQETEQGQVRVWLPPSCGQPEDWGQLEGHPPGGGSIVLVELGQLADVLGSVPGAAPSSCDQLRRAAADRAQAQEQGGLWVPPDLPFERWGLVLDVGPTGWGLIEPRSGAIAARAIAAGAYWA